MGYIQPGHVYKLLDKLTAEYTVLKGDGTYGAGVGGDGSGYGASRKGYDIDRLVSAASDASFADSDIQIPLGALAAQLQSAFSVDTLYGSGANIFVYTLSNVCSLARSVLNETVIDLNSYMYWYNWLDGITNHPTDATKFWRCLAAPEWKDAYHAAFGGTFYPNPKNLYYVVNDDTHANALYKIEMSGGLPSTFAGAVVDRDSYAGGFPYLHWRDVVGGAGAVAIAVTGLDQDGNAESYTVSGTWGVAPFNTPSEGSVALVPVANVYSLLTEVTTAEITGTVTSGDFFIECHAPAGRTWPAV